MAIFLPTRDVVLPPLKAVSDETRVRILHILSFGSFSVGEIGEILDMGQSRISRHLKILTEAGLIQMRREGSLVYSNLIRNGETPFFPLEIVSLLLSHKEDLPCREIDQRMVTSVLEKRERKTKGFFDKIAQSGGMFQEEGIGNRLYRDWIVNSLPSNQNLVLDLGSGQGSLIPYLLPKSKCITGVDSSYGMITNAKKLFGDNPSVQFLHANLENLPIAQASVDSVVASMVLHHISHPPLVLEEVGRVMRDGGTLVIVDLAKHDHEVMRDSFFDLWLGFDQELLESWITNAGFTIESSEINQTDSYFQILQIKAIKKEDSYVHSN